jgi:hypothetical protein
MANIGPNSPSTVVDDSSTGTIAWTNPTYIEASDSNYATITFDSVSYSHYLHASNFGFSLPTNAIIQGILVEIEAKASSYWILDFVRIVKGGTISSTNKAYGTYGPTERYRSNINPSSELWGETWTPSDINASNFGVAIATYSSNTSSYNISVNHVRITVYYTQPTSLTGISTITGVSSITF